MKGKLYIIPTPIGNLGDITYRAIKTLQSVDLILCEDTRTSLKLLQFYNINKKLKSYHAHNEHKIVSKIISLLVDGMNIGLISDAGMPSISDPGYLLISEAIKEDIEFECLPGAVAFVPALVQSGLPSNNFIFLGFLPVKKKRNKQLQELSTEKRTMIFYESPHRILKTLTDFKSHFGENRLLSVSKELTKKFETTFRGTIQETINHFEENTPKGEFVICVGGLSK